MDRTDALLAGSLAGGGVVLLAHPLYLEPLLVLLVDGMPAPSALSGASTAVGAAAVVCAAVVATGAAARIGLDATAVGTAAVALAAVAAVTWLRPDVALAAPAGAEANGAHALVAGAAAAALVVAGAAIDTARRRHAVAIAGFALAGVALALLHPASVAGDHHWAFVAIGIPVLLTTTPFGLALSGALVVGVVLGQTASGERPGSESGRVVR